MNMTKQNVKAALGLKTDSDLAEFFNIYPQAVSLWGDEKPIPIRRQLELYISHPKLFKSPVPKINVRAAHGKPSTGDEKL